MSLFKSVFDRIASSYRGIVAARLRTYGLRYDDLLIETPDMHKALSRTDADVRLARERRIKRAFDLSAKKKALPIEIAMKDEPMKMYLNGQIDVAIAEREQKQLLK
ncbi:ubiquinol:cytochrome c oxidoreductase 14 kDa subunit [Ochromonadaceae sp. CCMP2298]|nr:ubiquinol:cytochrome c oxidoreductase 14 kDa subunit [Ochromonadaceae sp. CCMP2298]KAJ1443788.1 ubiquinol:cytochrome c oxidoreductase 14 kDa subunit [Ochromonadaceae sp. CCMP2298]|eukprot:CAMPEP_0173200942 /NCGR_PEP_ID=MMETSP1141-20130122/18075_1 /TAXON_ID=483371 /ORGANISM="non described non described, Strain CCMP2298" /LENGTH=105 /DNA_ID=CAMNT_0014126007 /DNA_START=36 /DNA_END=353 /DNA_ORIENTATION=+